MALNAKQQRFVDEYVQDMNASQAALRAGYSPKTADRQGHRLLKNAEIAAEIARKQAETAEKLQLSHEWVIQRLMDNHDRAMQLVPVLDREGNETGEFRYEGNVANKALELIGKHLGTFADRIRHEGHDGGAVKTETTVSSVEAFQDEGVRAQAYDVLKKAQERNGAPAIEYDTSGSNGNGSNGHNGSGKH